MIGEDVPEWCWKKNFRMSKECFLKLADELRPFLAPKPDSPSCRALSTEKHLAITLYCLKDTGSLWMTANGFWNSSVYSVQAGTFSERGDQYDTGTKVLTLTKEHWRNAKKSFRV